MCILRAAPYAQTGQHAHPARYDEIIHRICGELGLPFHLYYAAQDIPLQNASDMFEKFKEMDAHNISGEVVVACSGNEAVENASNFTYFRHEKDIVSEFIESGNESQATACFDHLMDTCRSTGKMSKQMLLMLRFEYAETIVRILRKKGDNEVAAELLMQMFVKPCNTIEEFRDEFMGWLRLTTVGTPQQEDTHTVMESIKTFVADNIFENISREDIAGHVQYNPDYLSLVFKRETGVTISTYIQEEKIAMAIRLMEETTLSISEITRKLGYINYSYF